MKYLRKLFCFLFYILCVNSIHADDSGNELGQPLNFWTKGFNQKAYQKCLKILKTCKTDGPLKNKDCVDQKVENSNDCAQLNELSNWFGVPANALEIKPVQKFTIVKLNYIADGQTGSYVITPDGTMYDGNIDVRRVNKDLQKKYKKSNFMTNNWGDWKISKGKDNTHQFSMIQKITDACLACPVLLWANVTYTFDNNGKLINTAAQSIPKP